MNRRGARRSSGTQASTSFQELRPFVGATSHARATKLTLVAGMEPMQFYDISPPSASPKPLEQRFSVSFIRLPKKPQPTP